MTWLQEVPIFEGEDENALKSEFVRLSALYPDYSPFQIGEQVFRKLIDPYSRGQQAGAVWGRDLEILERIRTYRADSSIGGGDSEAQRLAWEIANDLGVDPKDRVAALTLYAKLRGELKKETELTVKGDAVQKLPTFKYAVYPDDE